jgi:hypothetical protein
MPKLEDYGEKWKDRQLRGDPQSLLGYLGFYAARTGEESLGD